jgi:protein-L-isoaspartate(D-aspartate) O-methyltransferase
MLLVRHIGSPVRFAANFVCRAHFVPCIGTEAPELRERLTRAFRAGTHERVRSLGVGPAPAVGVWFAGDGFWLSTEDPSV